MEIETPATKISARGWWLRKRCCYNIGLIISGLIAFMLYCILGEIIIGAHEEFEETIFEMVFQAGAFAIMIGIANVFYLLGWIIDSRFNKNNDQRFRQRLFALGFWFSFALPILVILAVMVRFMIFGQ
jgi:magnesium-transporting ATPase (P-type)